MKIILLIFSMAALALSACQTKGKSSNSAAQALRAGILTAEYVVPADADLGLYRPIEVWVESSKCLIVRLKGPHADTEPRVRVQGLTDKNHLGIWSEDGGPPYEIWTSPNPLPETLILERDNKKIELKKRIK